MITSGEALMVGTWHLLALSMDMSCHDAHHLEVIFHMRRVPAVRRGGLALSRVWSLVRTEVVASVDAAVETQSSRTCRMAVP